MFIPEIAKRSPIDWSRHDGLLDHELLHATHLTCIGAGGAAGLVQTLTRCGIGGWTLGDFDSISATNPATQAHDVLDAGRAKVAALADRVRRINPDCAVRAIPKRVSDLDRQEFEDIWSANMMLAMTDDFHTQSALNRIAVRVKTDSIFAIAYAGPSTAVEVTGTFSDTIAHGLGCHRCHTKARYDAYESGFQNPATIASHAAAAEYLNALLANIILGRLHYRAGSDLPIADIGRAFSEAPCLISTLMPSLAVPANADPAHRPAFSLPGIFYALDTPAGFICPDCGTPGVIENHPLSGPWTNPGPGITEKRS